MNTNETNNGAFWKKFDNIWLNFATGYWKAFIRTDITAETPSAEELTDIAAKMFEGNETFLLQLEKNKDMYPDKACFALLEVFETAPEKAKKAVLIDRIFNHGGLK